MSITIPKLHIVIPVYNEDKNVIDIVKQIEYYARKYQVSYHIYFIDDHSSSSETLWNLSNVCMRNDVSVFTNKGKGQQAAILYGFYQVYGSNVYGDYICTLDCDMQDPVKELFKMYKLLICNQDSYNAAIGVRNTRDDLLLKRMTAMMYYKLQSFILGTYVPNASNFYILRVKDVLSLDMANLSGSLLMQFQVMRYKYDRQRRICGNTKYSMSRLCKLAYRGIIWSLSYKHKNKLKKKGLRLE